MAHGFVPQLSLQGKKSYIFVLGMGNDFGGEEFTWNPVDGNTGTEAANHDMQKFHKLP